MDTEKLRVTLKSIVPEKLAELHWRHFSEEEERLIHRAEVAAWNKCRDAVIDKANKIYRDALEAEEAQ